jgi:hypothetical protein
MRELSARALNLDKGAVAAFFVQAVQRGIKGGIKVHIVSWGALCEGHAVLTERRLLGHSAVTGLGDTGNQVAL